MSSRNRNIAIAIGVIVVMIASKLLLPLPKIPNISLAPEAIAHFGNFPFTNSLLMTLVVDILLIGLAVAGVGRMKAVPRGLQNVVELAVELLYRLGESIDRRMVSRFFTLSATVFFFVFFANIFALFPGVGSIGVCSTHEAALVNHVPGEVHVADPTSNAGTTCGEGQILVPLLRAPSADLNMTLAFALIVFVATEYFGFRELGFSYLGKFFNFREGPIGFIVGIVELISEFVRIVSFMFRLFGNIFAGEVVLLVMAFLVPWLLPSVFYGYEIFVAFIQAFIFSILAMVFISLAVERHGGHADHGHEEAPADSRQQVAH